MINALELTNPFDVKLEQVVRWTAPEGCSIRAVLCERDAGFTEFEHPTLCLVNSEPWMRARWDEPVPLGATVSFVRLAEGIETLIIILIVAIVAAVVVALTIKPTNPAATGADRENGDPVYLLTGERNQNKLNSSIECVYGHCRLWPSYAARPYNTFKGQQQYQYSLFCLGHGWFRIEDMYFEDTPLLAFDDVEFEIVNPGETFDLFSDNVETSLAVSNIELFAPNEEEYNGFTAAYVANGPYTRCVRLEVDVELPAGLYEIDSESGKVESAEITASFQYASIDDLGNRTSGWIDMVFSEKKIEKTQPSNAQEGDTLVSRAATAAIAASKTQYTTVTVPYFYKRLHTVTPQRYTLSANVPSGRYVVRAKRVSSKNKSVQSGNVIRWQTLRAFFPSVRNYGDVTLVAVKARATNNLNNNAAARFNVVVTRRLPVWTAAKGWTQKVITRNPIWAFCDAFMATYGGRLPDKFLDLQELRALADSLDASKTTFDHIFDQKSTVWEVARTIARVCRGVPMLNASRVTIIRDLRRTFASAMFNQNNIISGSLSWGIKLRNVEDYDGVEVEYLDPETWQRETVLCLIGEDKGDNPRTMKLLGCTSRTLAFQEGLYARANELYVKEDITFKTGLEGFLPRYGDMVLVSHDVPRWGSGGYVREIVGQVLTLTEPAVFVDNTVHRLLLRRRDGSAYGPITVTPGVDAYHVVSQYPIGEDFSYDSAIQEPPIYLFGVADYESKRCTVVGINPEGEDVVAIKCVNYTDRLFSFAGVPTPAKYTTPRSVTDPARPVVRAMQVSIVPNVTDFILISWEPALGARNYLLEQSTDGVNWTRIVTQPSTIYQMKVVPQILWLRVAGVNTDIGPWLVWMGRVGDVRTVPARVLNLHLTDLGPGTMTVGWTGLANVDGYEVTIFNRAEGFFLRRVTVLGLAYTYTLDDAEDDGYFGNEILIRLKGINILGVSATATVLNVTIPPRRILPPDVTADSITLTADSTLVTADRD